MTIKTKTMLSKQGNFLGWQVIIDGFVMKRFSLNEDDAIKECVSIYFKEYKVIADNGRL
jgi:hypothetical protein